MAALRGELPGDVGKPWYAARDEFVSKARRERVDHGSLGEDDDVAPHARPVIVHKRLPGDVDE